MVLFCPRCKSKNVSSATPRTLTGRSVSFGCRCLDCGFRAPIFPDSIDKKRSKKEIAYEKNVLSFKMPKNHIFSSLNYRVYIFIIAIIIIIILINILSKI